MVRGRTTPYPSLPGPRHCPYEHMNVPAKKAAREAADFAPRSPPPPPLPSLRPPQAGSPEGSGGHESPNSGPICKGKG